MGLFFRLVSVLNRREPQTLKSGWTKQPDPSRPASLRCSVVPAPRASVPRSRWSSWTNRPGRLSATSRDQLGRETSLSSLSARERPEDSDKKRHHSYHQKLLISVTFKAVLML